MIQCIMILLQTVNVYVAYSVLTNVITKSRSNSQPIYFFGEAHPLPKSWGYKMNDLL